MKLIDIDHKTDLIQKAIKEGITDIEEYSVWLMGYTSGYKDCQKDVRSRLKEGES